MGTNHARKVACQVSICIRISDKAEDGRLQRRSNSCKNERRDLGIIVRITQGTEINPNMESKAMELMFHEC